jgi:glutamate carboxypeptidase
MQPGEWERIETEMKKLKPVLEGTSIEVTGDLNRPPMPFDERMLITFEKAKSIAEQTGLEVKASGTGGASDANFVAPLGIPLMDGLGGIGDGAHSDREFIYADSLEQKVKLVSAILRSW